MDASEKITAACSFLILDHPFFAAIVLRLALRPGRGCRTGYTDGVEIVYNPDWIDTLTLDETEAFLAHDAMHFALRHHLRRGDRERNLWNLAGDCVINLILKSQKFQLPRDTWIDPACRNKDTEEVYELLKKQRQYRRLEGLSEDLGGCGAVRDHPGPETVRAERNWKLAMARALQTARAAGNVPAGLESVFSELSTGSVNWKEVLSVFLSETLGPDYTWKAPNPRYMAAGVYLPSHLREKGGRIAVFIDTSASVGPGELRLFLEEICGIASAYQVEVTVVYADCEVAGVERFYPGEVPTILRPKGGGGTDYRPAFAWAEREGLDPNCAVYLTDGACDDFPERDPGYPVLWAVTWLGFNFKAPWGEVMRLKW